jgi:hypothetical protein
MKMKIQLKDLHDSPFRNFDRNPLIDERVQSLVASIESTNFWDNVVVRPTPNGEGFQLAYGHHRLAAVREAINPDTKKPFTFIEVPCRDLSDATMIKMMADENLNQWGHSVAATLEAVEAARDFLESGLEVCETAEEFTIYCAINRKNIIPVNVYTAYCAINGGTADEFAVYCAINSEFIYRAINEKLLRFARRLKSFARIPQYARKRLKNLRFIAQ